MSKLFRSHTNRDGQRSKDPSWLFLIVFLVVVSDLVSKDSCDLFANAFAHVLLAFLTFKPQFPPEKLNSKRLDHKKSGPPSFPYETNQKMAWILPFQQLPRRWFVSSGGRRWLSGCGQRMNLPWLGMVYRTHLWWFWRLFMDVDGIGFTTLIYINYR